MNSFLKYLAKSSRGCNQYLKKQLKYFGLTPKYLQTINSFQFRANYQQLFRICFHCRTIETLKIQIGQRFYARDQKQLTNNLKRLPFHSFIKNQRLENDRFPHIRVDSKDSYLNSRDIKYVLQKHLSLMPIVKEYRKIQKLGLDASMSNVKRIIQYKKQLIHQNKQNSIQYKKHLSGQQTDLNIIQKYQNSQQQIIHAQMQNNYCRIYTNVNFLPLYKHGWKTKVGWAPIRESIAAAILINIGIIEIAKSQKKLKLWDPFCGSGTLLFQALSLLVQKPIRENYKQHFAFQQWPSFKNTELEKYLENQQKFVTTNCDQIDIKLLGSDISLQAINYSIQNYKKLGINLEKYKKKVDQQFIRRNPNHQVYTVQNGQVYFIAQDFQKVGNQILKQEGFTILTNLPYGIRSQQIIPRNQLNSIYLRFSKFIKKNSSKFRNVFILLPIQKVFSQDHFFNFSSSNWSLRETFTSGGIQIGLYSLQDSNELVIPINIQKGLIKQKEQKNQIMIQAPILQKIPSLIGNIQLPKHMIEKKPRNLRQRLLWKKKMHALKIQYKKHLQMRQYSNIMKHFLKQRLMRQLRKRGESWRAKNLSLVGGKPQKYSEQIQGIFEQKIYKAIQKQEKEKNKKEQKKRKNKNIVKNKW